MHKLILSSIAILIITHCNAQKKYNLSTKSTNILKEISFGSVWKRVRPSDCIARGFRKCNLVTTIDANGSEILMKKKIL